VNQPSQGYGPSYPPPPPGWRPTPPPPLSPGGQPLADFGTRFLSYLIDSAIITAVLTVLALPVMAIFFATQFDRLSTTDPYGPQPDIFRDFIGPLLLIELGLILAVLVIYYIYNVELMYRTGQTVGKKAMKIRVVPLDPAAPLTRTMAAKRYLVEYIGGLLIPFFSYLDGLWQLWDKPYQQTLHDRFAQTVVIKVSA
jgi:uncharacterized RDD family membrane protein YckC